ncbi:MAG: LacI family DNA-binding transcriptional regulator [Telluria sp.]
MTSSSLPLSDTIGEIKTLLRRPRRVTSYDVASLAGVSQSAVSRCFKPGASVSKSTYARVMKAAQELDYTPNAAARSLITRRSNLVAAVLSEMALFTYPDILTELTRQFAQRGIRVVLFTYAKEDQLDSTLAGVWQHQVDGAVVAARLQPGQVAEFERRGVPFVLFNRQLRDQSVHAIVCDQVEAARTMVTRLAGAGHKRFALIDGPLESSVAQERRRGITDRLHELGLPEPVVVSGNYDYASGARGLREIMARCGRAPDAILCGNDVMAIGCIDAARHDFHLRVPDDVSITGFDGIAQASWLCYNVTTLRQPVQPMATATADMLLALIGADSGCAERRVFSAVLVEGGTARLGPAA